MFSQFFESVPGTFGKYCSCDIVLFTRHRISLDDRHNFGIHQCTVFKTLHKDFSAD